jgi:hypothetical protein
MQHSFYVTQEGKKRKIRRIAKLSSRKTGHRHGSSKIVPSYWCSIVNKAIYLPLIIYKYISHV